MNIKIISLLLVLFCCSLQAQDYVDLVKLSSNNASMNNIDNSFTTNINNLKLELYLPKRINEQLVILAGATVENTMINLLGGEERSHLLMTRLNLGIKYQHSERWSGTYVVLPKIASDFKRIDQQDIQFGGLALMGYQLSETWNLKFGLYVSSENHGSTITPLLGVWHRSKNGKFYINAVLPIRMDINYHLIAGLSVGADVLTSVKSYSLWRNDRDHYVQEESIRLGGYLSYGFFQNALILRARAGYDTTEYGLYRAGDQIGGQLLTFPLSGDARDRLNPELLGAFYFGGDLIYRFDLNKEKK